MSVIRVYRRAWRNGRRWLHNPACGYCDQGERLSSRDACPCGIYYDEAPREWRDLDRVKAHQTGLPG